MSDKKIPLARGSLLDIIKKRTQEKREREQAGIVHSVETPSQSSSDQTGSFGRQSSFGASTSTTIGIGRGRAQITNLLKIHSSSSGSASSSALIGHKASQRTDCGTSHVAVGRGNVINLLMQKRGKADLNASTSGNTSTSAQTDTLAQKDSDGVLGALADLTIYDNPPSPVPEDVELLGRDTAPERRLGTSGVPVKLFANYINLELEPGKGLFQYEVKFTPDIDSRGLRRNLLNQHAVKIGRVRTFDGVTLFLPIRLPQNIIYLDSDHPADGSKVTLAIIYKRQQSMSENVQFFNILFGRIMRALNLVRIGRQNFNPHNSHVINQHQLEVWPGYVTAVNEYDGGLKLCLDIKHRVLRTQTVRDLMTDVFEKQRHNYRDCVMKEIIGSSVLTRYNNKTYRIDDIAWDKTPEFKFSKNGEEMSLLYYYKKFCGIKIKDEKQPLLVHRATERTSTGEKQEKILLLIPELSYVSGLTDSIRSNYKMMKDLDTVTKISPHRRRNEIRRFVEEIQNNEITRDILSGWGLRLCNDITQFTARCLPPETIYIHNNKSYFSHVKPTDWTNFVTRNPVLRTPHLNKWYILYVNRDGSIVNDFLKVLQSVVKTIGMRVNEPHKIALRDDRNESYLQEIRRNFNSGYELVIAVFPTNRTDRYNALKRLCCVEKPIASQVIISKTIANSPKLKNITEKIALQINCKLGGALWTVSMPLKHCMVCGIDVYHAATGSAINQSVAGFVASLDVQLSKWHSKVCMQASKQELMDMLQMCFISAINAYRKHNNYNPERIIIYRDGVGDGDLDYVVKYEVKQLLATFNRIDPNYKPQLSVIVVQKRINTRLFLNSRDELVNPAAGTVVDSYITRQNCYDFFLVPQNVRQGSVTPIHYIVIHDSSNMQGDHMQRLTYKLCHLYYNWTGTIRIPAPCQYAHKLVYQVGQSLHVEPHHSLEDTLYYL